jgi:hypothetical protein
MGAGFLVLTVHIIGGIVGGCMLCNLLRSADTGPFGNALLGAVGGVFGAGVVFALSPAFTALPGLSGPLFAGILAGAVTVMLAGLGVNALRRRA